MSNTPTKKQIEDAFAAEVQKDNLCTLGKLLEATPADQRAVIEEKVADDLHYSAKTIARVLKALDFPAVSSEMVTKHRRGICRCPNKR